MEEAIRFVLVWQSSRSAKEAADALGLDLKVAIVRASRFRRHHVPLQKFDNRPRPRRVIEGRAFDWKLLIKLGAALCPSSDGLLTLDLVGEKDE